MISKRLLGTEVSKDTVSSSLDLLADEASKWLTRPITDRYWALYVDGTNFRVQRRGSTRKEPSLVVLGVDEHNYRSILAIEPGTKDNVDSWRAVFAELKRRGLRSDDIRLGIMDGLPGLETLFKEEFSGAQTQRCWVHSLRNSIAKTPARLRFDFAALARKVMYAQSEDDARQAFAELKGSMQTDADRAVRCLEKDMDSLVTHYRFNRKLWTALRTTNAIETINRQFKRRTQNMDTMGEQTLETVLAFVALKIEMGWRKHKIDSGVFNRIDQLTDGNVNAIEAAIEQIGILH